MLSLQANSQCSKLFGHAGASRCTTVLSGIVIIALLLSVFLTREAAASKADKPSENWGFNGRIQFDAVAFSSDNPKFKNGAEPRRVRFGYAGNLMPGLKVKLEYELSTGKFKPRGLYLRQKFGENSAIRVGHFRVPVSLQTATSSINNTFMERALPHAASTGFRLGAMASTYGNYWSATGGITGGRLTDAYQMRDQGVGLFVRGVLNPVNQNNRLWHLALGSEIRRYAPDDKFTLSSQPESSMGTRMVNTFRILGLDQTLRYSGELAWKLNSLHFQAEYTGLNATRLTGPDLSFGGWYAQAGWFISGESRRYNRRKGSFRKTIPDRWFGAWEVAIRYSEIDLNSADIRGGTESNIGIALNWYATKSVRFSLNYIEASARPNRMRRITAHPITSHPIDIGGVNDDVSIVQARFQFAF